MDLSFLNPWNMPRSLSGRPRAQELGRGSSHWYLRAPKQRWSPSAVYLLRRMPYFHTRAPWHRSQSAYPGRTSRDYAQRLLVLNSSTTPRHQMCLIPPLQIQSMNPVELHRLTILRDYNRNLTLYGARWSDFVHRDWHLGRHRATIRRETDSLNSSHPFYIVHRGCYLDSFLYCKDISAVLEPASFIIAMLRGLLWS